MNTIVSQFLAAMFLPIALHPTVREEMTAVIKIVMRVLGKENFVPIAKVKTAPKLPLTIPHISPITS